MKMKKALAIFLVLALCFSMLSALVACDDEVTIYPEYYNDDAQHWQLNSLGEKANVGSHFYSNDTDTTCDVCGYVRVVTLAGYHSDETYHWQVTSAGEQVNREEHVYDNDGDEICNVCEYQREVAADQRWYSDEDNHWHLSEAGNKVGEEAHEYDDENDTTCNDCGYTRYVVYSAWCTDGSYHWKEDSLGQEVNKTTHKYSNENDTTCNDCGYTRALANFSVPSTGYDGSEINITFYHTMGETLRNELDKAIERFNKLYPNIHITHTQVGGYDDVKSTISTELTTGNTDANIAYCYPDHIALYNNADAVVQLDNLIASTVTVTRADGTTETLGLTEEQINDFIPGFYAEGSSFGDGLMYSLPFSKSTEVLYYNKTFFEANNLSVPTTWDEMEELCQRILEIDTSGYCVPLGYDSESNWFITMCEQYGSDYTSATGDHYLFDNEVNRAFVQRFANWYTKGYVTTQELYGAYTSGLFTETSSSAQHCYMCIGSTGGAGYQVPDQDTDGNYLFEVGIASIPQVDTNNPKVISQGPSVCIFQKDDPQEVIASWLFVKFLTTDVEFQASFSVASGYAPVIKSVSEYEGYKTYLAGANGTSNLTALAAKVCLEQEDAYFVSPAFNGSSVAREQVGLLMQKVFTGKSVEEAFTSAVEECNYKAG